MDAAETFHSAPAQRRRPPHSSAERTAEEEHHDASDVGKRHCRHQPHLCSCSSVRSGNTEKSRRDEAAFSAHHSRIEEGTGALYPGERQTGRVRHGRRSAYRADTGPPVSLSKRRRHSGRMEIRRRPHRIPLPENMMGREAAQSFSERSVFHTKRERERVYAKRCRAASEKEK